MSTSRVILCVVSLFVCLFTIVSLAAVLSYPNIERAARPVLKAYCEQSWDLCIDILLIFGALFLHYLLNCMDLFADCSTSTQRCVYSLFTALIMQGAMLNWRRTSLFNLWTYQEISEPAKWLITIIHCMAYLQLIANSVFDEAIEAFGFRNWSDLTSEHSDYETTSYFNKSQELARLEGRLPSSGGLLLISVLFILYPTMPLERALAALALISYNFCTSTLEEQDYFYVRRHFLKKWDELLHFEKTSHTYSNLFDSSRYESPNGYETMRRSSYEERLAPTGTVQRRRTGDNEHVTTTTVTRSMRRSTRT